MTIFNIGYLIVDWYFIIGLDEKNILFYDEVMIKINLKNSSTVKSEKIKSEEMKLFAKEQFFALAKKNISIPIRLYHL